MSTATAQQCELLSDVIVDLVDDQAALSTVEAEHVGQCLRCQAEIARFRRLSRVLSGLREDCIDSDPAWLDSLFDRLDSVEERRERQRLAGRRAVSLMGLAAATAAGVGGVFVLASRRRSA